MYPGDLGYLSATAWLVDRTAEESAVIGSAWMLRDGEVVTLASLILPFVDNPESLAVHFPITGNRFGVKDFKFHSNFDRWMGKRKLQESQFFPNHALLNSPYNIAGIRLTHNLKNLGRDTMTRLKNKVHYNKIDEEPDLTGQADNLQIVSIIQTLMNARNIGTMMLLDNLDRVVARFCLSDQKVTHIQYQNLFNEQALDKLICTLDGEMKFHFKRELDPEWANFPAIEKPTAGLLMGAYGILEESSQLYQGVGGKNIEIVRTAEELSLMNLTEAQCPPVACVWNHIKFPVPISRVVRSCSFDGATVLNALKYLVDSGQAKIGAFDPPSMEEIKTISLTSELDLAQGLEVYCLSADNHTGKGSVDMGYVLNPTEHESGTQYIHSIGLPIETLGAPIVFEDKVIGINSGWLIDGFENYKEWIHPGLMISAENIYECLEMPKPGNKVPITAEVESDISDEKEDETLFEMKPIAVNERLTENVDEIPEETTSNEASLPLPEKKEAPERESKPLPRATPADRRRDPNKLSGFFKSVAGMISTIGSSGEGIEVQLHRQSLDSERYERINPDAPLLIGDFVRLKLKALGDCKMIALFQAGPEQPVELLYPGADNSSELEKGEQLTIPTEAISIVSAGVMQNYSGFPLNFREQESEIVVIFAFDDSLDILINKDDEGTRKLAILNALIGKKNLEFHKFALEGETATPVSDQQVSKEEKRRVFACHLSIKMTG